jgi:tRNA G18 (ribose-2'-O)-methylase SpoU
VFQVQKIDSLQLPELQPYRTMRRQHEHRQQGIFVAEGEKVVRRLLASRFGVVSVLLPEKWFVELSPLLKARPETVQVYLAEKSVLETLIGFSMYQGLLAVGKIPKPVPLSDILDRSQLPYLLVALDGLSSAENVGALVRNCAAFNVQALLIGETSSSPYLRRAVRSSMGTVFQLPIVECAGLVTTLQSLRALGIRCIAAHPHVSGKTPAQCNLVDNCCLVFGSEGYGLAPTTLAACDEAVAIPMASEIDSLNVSSAAAVLLYEGNRRRVSIQE